MIYKKLIILSLLGSAISLTGIASADTVTGHTNISFCKDISGYGYKSTSSVVINCPGNPTNLHNTNWQNMTVPMTGSVSPQAYCTLTSRSLSYNGDRGDTTISCLNPPSPAERVQACKQAIITAMALLNKAMTPSGLKCSPQFKAFVQPYIDDANTQCNGTNVPVSFPACVPGL